ncbi:MULTISPECIES: IS110 family transposase [Paraburkholderia]|uniref:IS110 family transposase n=1 Tax=Paraburkholderia TaxID=1822464 RepID=UPI000377FFD6|nr:MULTISPECIES: transposase [Paraburkholderia]MDH6153659.1 hypothetical protein [Paraburkholderia sp. WSM4179]
MAQPKPRRTVARRTDMSVVNRHAAGIDVGAQFHVVAVGPECAEDPVRSFRSFTADLHELARWLRQVKVTTVVMESTGIYWLPVFEILESYGFEVLLVNAREAKSVPGRKSDVNDAQWLQKLHRYRTPAFDFGLSVARCLRGETDSERTYRPVRNNLTTTHWASRPCEIGCA